MKSRIGGNLLNAFCYLLAFLIIQFVMTLVGGTIWLMVKGEEFRTALEQAANGSLANDGTAMAVITAAASVVTIIVFMLFRWSPFSRTYLRSRPWGVLAWVFILTFGTVIPSEWLLEQLNVEMSEPMQQLFEEIMKSPVGYIAIGLLAPLAEEMVFRGAILRSLLRWKQNPWVGIAISALLFAVVHMNPAQMPHAFLIGLLLGWMYWRTDSIVPGVVYHWVNNTVAYILYNIYPDPDLTLVEMFGSEQKVLMALGFSLLIFLPSLFQLNQRLAK